MAQLGGKTVLEMMGPVIVIFVVITHNVLLPPDAYQVDGVGVIDGKENN